MKTDNKWRFFNDTFSSGSRGCSGECHCGIMHYDSANQWDIEYHQNMLPQALEAAEASPERFQFHESSIEYLNFNDRLYVAGCRCGMDHFVFTLLNEEKQSILKYYISTKDELSPEGLLT